MYSLIIILIFTSHRLDIVNSVNYCKRNEIPDVVAELSECGSCNGRCGNIMNASHATCSCDDLCMSYTDCCGDFEKSCPRDNVKAQSISKYYGQLRSSCIYVNDVQYDLRPTLTISAMVTRCSNDRACVFNMLNNSFILEHGTPVIDSLYGVMFVNAECAVCNGVPPLRIRPLEATLSCQSLQEMDLDDFAELIASNMSYEEFASKWLPNNPWFGDETAVQRDIMDSKFGPNETFKDPMNIITEILSTTACIVAVRLAKTRRYCAPQTQACPSNCTNKKLVKQCHNGYQGLVMRKSSTVTYRNIYCGLCNIGHGDDFVCGYSVSLGVLPPGAFSLSLLFDVNQDQRTVLRSLETTCQKANQKIPGGVHCGQTVCSQGYMHNGKHCSKDVQFDTNVTLTFDITIETSGSCNQTDNTGALKEELHAAFIYALYSLCNGSRARVEINITRTCFHLASNYSLDVLISTSNSKDLRNLPSIVQVLGILVAWNVFKEFDPTSNIPEDTMRMTSGNISIALTKSNLESTECKGFFLVKDKRDFHDVLVSRNDANIVVGERISAAINYSVPICIKNKSKGIISSVSGVLAMQPLLYLLCRCSV